MVGMEHWSSNLTPLSFSQKKLHELSFKEGDLMVVLKEDDGWWKVEHSDGRKGYIPSNYVKAVVSITVQGPGRDNMQEYRWEKGRLKPRFWEWI